MIAYALLYTVAVGVPVLLAAWAVATVLRRYGRAERWVWLSGLVLSYALPLYGLLRGLAIAANGTAGAPTAAPATGVIGLPEIVVFPGGAAGAGTANALVLLWTGASLLLGLRLAVAALRLARAGRSWQPDTLDGVPVWLSDDIGPAVAGLLRPRVLVPGWLAHMPADKRSLVLLHEQEHIRAGDPWLMLLSRIAPVLTPWNPVVWMISSRLLQAIELDCDRRVLRRRPDVRTYGTTLIEISSRDRGRLIAVAAFAESEAPLRSRILNMTTPSRAVSIAALMVSLVFGVLLIAAAFEIPVPAIRAELALGSTRVDVPAVEPPVGMDPRVEEGLRAREPVLRGSAEALARSQIEATEAAAEELDRAREDLIQAREDLMAEQAADAAGAEEALLRLRAEREARLAEDARRRASAVPLTASSSRAPGVDLSARPTFTPFTVAPALLNLTDVQQALTREYPTVLRDSGIGGRVTVWFYIDEDGLVRRTLLNQSSGYAALDEAAMNVAEVYRFSPARNRDEPVPVWVALPITFQMR